MVPVLDVLLACTSRTSIGVLSGLSPEPERNWIQNAFMLFTDGHDSLCFICLREIAGGVKHPPSAGALKSGMHTDSWTRCMIDHACIWHPLPHSKFRGESSVACILFCHDKTGVVSYVDSAAIHTERVVDAFDFCLTHRRSSSA